MGGKQHQDKSIYSLDAVAYIKAGSGIIYLCLIILLRSLSQQIFTIKYLLQMTSMQIHLYYKIITKKTKEPVNTPHIIVV